MQLTTCSLTMPTSTSGRRSKTAHACPLCKKEPQTLIHVLNACTVALNWRRYNTRHDAVLAELSKTISQSLGPDYSFPLHLATTDLRPDMVWWNDNTKTATLLELTIPFDTILDDAAKRKEAKYLDLVSSIKEAGFTTNLLTVEMGSRAWPAQCQQVE